MKVAQAGNEEYLASLKYGGLSRCVGAVFIPNVS
jgi:hypothetical protein